MASPSLESLLGWVNALEYGVAGNGVQDDAPALAQLLSTYGNGKTIVLPAINPWTLQPAVYYLGSAVTIPSGTTVIVTAGVSFSGPGSIVPGSGHLLDLRPAVAITTPYGVAVNGPLYVRNTSGTNPARNPIANQVVTTLPAGNQTITAAQLLGGVIEHPVTASVTDTTDTGANIDAALGSPAVGDSFECALANTAAGAYTITLAGGAGVTLKGATSIAQGAVAQLLFVRTGPGAWTCYVSIAVPSPAVPSTQDPVLQLYL